MEERTKYILIGIVIGIAIEMTIFYLLMTFRIIQPFGLFGFRGFERGNLTNFPRPVRGG